MKGTTKTKTEKIKIREWDWEIKPYTSVITIYANLSD